MKQGKTPNKNEIDCCATIEEPGAYESAVDHTILQMPGYCIGMLVGNETIFT